jgi:hypothetical protein
MQKRLYLWQEILVILSLKLALIFALWWLFFSDPLDEKLQSADVSSHLFNSNNFVRSPNAS